MAKFSDKGVIMKLPSQRIKSRVREWCNASGWTEPHLSNGCYWAIPPNGQIPVPLIFRELNNSPSKADKQLALFVLVAKSIDLIIIASIGYTLYEAFLDIFATNFALAFLLFACTLCVGLIFSLYTLKVYKLFYGKELVIRNKSNVLFLIYIGALFASLAILVYSTFQGLVELIAFLMHISL